MTSIGTCSNAVVVVNEMLDTFERAAYVVPDSPSRTSAGIAAGFTPFTVRRATPEVVTSTFSSEPSAAPNQYVPGFGTTKNPVHFAISFPIPGTAAGDDHANSKFGSNRWVTNSEASAIPLLFPSLKIRARNPKSSARELYDNDPPIPPPSAVTCGDDTEVVTFPVARFTDTGPSDCIGDGPSEPSRWSNWLVRNDDVPCGAPW